MQRMTTALRKLVNAGKFLELPTAYDAIKIGRAHV